MSDENIEEFYSLTKNFVQEKEADLSPEILTVVHFRVALEKGAEKMGMPVVTYLISRLLSVTLGVMAGDPSATYEDVLKDFEGKTQH